MTRNEIIKELKKFFEISELVCRHVYGKFGEKSWQFFDRDFLETLLIVRRDILQVPMKVNNWASDSLPKYNQRGLRCNLCNEVKIKTLNNELYMSSHPNGAGIDFDAKDMTVTEVHQKIKENAHLLPVRVRMESGVNWNHLDIYDDPMTTEKFTEFNA